MGTILISTGIKIRFMNKVVFITFADSKYKQSLARLKAQVGESNYITDKYLFTEKDLDKNFKKNFHPCLYRRCYGYWKWKSYLVKKVFDTLNNGDIIIYADAGCVFNIKADEKLLYYINRVKNSNSGLLVFAQNYIEKDWTKADCFNYFGVLNDKTITETPQNWAGSFLICKNNISTKIIDEWANVSLNHYDLITDKRSLIKNSDSFIEHRHDQSVLSVLAKIYKAETMPSSEIEKSNYDNIPIQPARLKQQSTISNLIHKLMKPYRLCIGLYLVYFEGFYFKYRKSW